MTKKADKAAQVEANKRTAYVTKVRRLMGFMFYREADTAAQIGYASGVDADTFAAAYLAEKSVVGSALHPAKTEAMARARKHAQSVIDRVLLDLENHGMDINACAPYPPRTMSVWDKSRDSMIDKHNLYASLTKVLGPTSYRLDAAPKIVTMSDEGMQRFIDQAERSAAIEYDAFICKMVVKVGDVVSAEIKGSHVWGHSYLTVVTTDGSKQVWKTQQIVNFSALGNAYNQWPSRIVK